MPTYLTMYSFWKNAFSISYCTSIDCVSDCSCRFSLSRLMQQVPPEVAIPFCNTNDTSSLPTSLLLILPVVTLSLLAWISFRCSELSGLMKTSVHCTFGGDFRLLGIAESIGDSFQWVTNVEVDGKEAEPMTTSIVDKGGYVIRWGIDSVQSDLKLISYTLLIWE